MDQLALDHNGVAVVKGLILDATAKAKSGHPGGAMSSADFAYILFKDFLRYDPSDPDWANRDRFVLSAGHESMLLYALLALQGRIGVDDLKLFRQFNSRTPGHPEHHMTPGVEASTGPLGQGMAMSVGLALGEAMKRARLGEDVCSHHTFALASDGDLQEPVALGAASLAGLWGLGKLVVYYDSNKVQLSGPTLNADCTDYRKVFEGLCWNVLEIDGHDHAQIRHALITATMDASRPTLIIGHTVMAKGAATREGDFTTHGAPMPEAEIKATKLKLGLPEEQCFCLPKEAVAHFRERQSALEDLASSWRTVLSAKIDADPGFADLWRVLHRSPANRNFSFPEFAAGTKCSTRKAWGKALNSLIEAHPFLVGGSADLDPSNMTEEFRKTVGDFCPENPLGRNLAFGVREFPMGAVLNGLALYGGFMAFGATFLAFSDYERGALRLSSLQELPVLHVFTHDSFHVGEDGPTHQPIEHVSSLRLIPNMLVMRPADAGETCACLNVALKQAKRPTSLILSRQDLPVLDPAAYPAIKDGAKKGGYVLTQTKEGEPEVLLLASGSEVSLALDAAALLPELSIRIVNMPCMELFDEQEPAYRESVIPSACQVRVAVEAGRPELWYKYVGCQGLVHGLSHFGHSAPASMLCKEYGFTPEALAAQIRAKASAMASTVQA